MADKSFKVNEGIEIESGKTLKVGGQTLIDTDGKILWSKVKGFAGYAVSNHNHNDTYYTETEVDTLISNLRDEILGDSWSTELNTNLNTLVEIENLLGDDTAFSTTIIQALSSKSPSTHLHDDRYYKEIELQTSGQANVHYDNVTNKPAILTDTAETVQDLVGSMTNSTNGLTITYDDVTGKLNYTVSTQSDNNFTSTLKTKLDGIEASADVTDTTNVVAALTAGTNVTIAGNGTISSTDTNTTYSVGDGGLTQKNFTTADHSKLDGIEAGANNYTHPANHTISEVTGLQTELDDIETLALAGL